MAFNTVFKCLFPKPHGSSEFHVGMKTTVFIPQHYPQNTIPYVTGLRFHRFRSHASVLCCVTRHGRIAPSKPDLACHLYG